MAISFSTIAWWSRLVTPLESTVSSTIKGAMSACAVGGMWKAICSKLVSPRRRKVTRRSPSWGSSIVWISGGVGALGKWPKWRWIRAIASLGSKSPTSTATALLGW
ncbi:hypothetical protein D3C78_1554090 [compost metagenome]